MAKEMFSCNRLECSDGGKSMVMCRSFDILNFMITPISSDPPPGFIENVRVVHVEIKVKVVRPVLKR
jgi:hypothetical protein